MKNTYELQWDFEHRKKSVESTIKKFAVLMLIDGCHFFVLYLGEDVVKFRYG